MKFKRTLYCMPLLFFFLAVLGIQAQKTITGTLTDSENLPLSGVNIIVKGTSTGVVSDFDGNYSVAVDANATTLIFTYLGFRTQEINIGNNTTINVQMIEDATELQGVFVSATRRPVRQIETTTAVQSISSQEIENLNPTSLVDIVKFTPGVFTQNKAGRVRNFIFIRGFPDASSNGLLYTSLMIDGVKTFASTEMVPDGSFRNDLNVDKVEVIRGAAATLYGRGAAAGAVNVISKTGGKQHGGTFKSTVGNNNWFQFDANMNGPLSKDKSWRYNVGGFWLRDDGYRDGPADDKGGQIRANIDKIFNNDKGNLRLYGGYIDLRVNNYLDIPYALNDLTKPAGDWESNDVVLQRGNPWEGQAWPVSRGDNLATNEYDEWIPRGNGSLGYNVGANLNLDLGNGFGLSAKTRYQDIQLGVSFDFPINNVGGAGNSPINTFGDTQLRAIIGGGLTDGGSDAKDFINELRINKLVKGANVTHNFTVGGYLSFLDVGASADGALYTANTVDPDNVQVNINPFGPAAGIIGLSFRNTRNDEDTYSVFVGDEIKFGDKLTVNAGFRYDEIRLNFVEDPDTDLTLTREEIHSGSSYSLGFNYLFDEDTAIYGNGSRSYRAPDYGTYSPLREGPSPGTFDKPRITENENITSAEVGFRKSAADWSFDGGIFYTQIANRRVATFINAIATQVPAGDNTIFGSELSFIYTPRTLPGFYARTNLTFQSTRYTDFTQEITYIDPSDTSTTITETIDFEGNDIANVPPLNWNVSLGYSTDKFGINVNNGYLAARPIDPYNTADYPARNLMDANIFYNINSKLQVRLASTNLLNTQAISSAISVQNAASPTLYVANQFNNQGQYANIFGIPLLPRRILASLQYTF